MAFDYKNAGVADISGPAGRDTTYEGWLKARADSLRKKAQKFNSKTAVEAEANKSRARVIAQTADGFAIRPTIGNITLFVTPTHEKANNPWVPVPNASAVADAFNAIANDMEQGAFDKQTRAAFESKGRKKS